MKSRFRQITAIVAAIATLGVAVIPGFTSNAQDAGLAAAQEAVNAAVASVEEKMEALAVADEVVETYDASVTFPDVRPGDWYYEAVAFATENGIMSGYTDTGKFGPADSLTREQFATVLYRMSGSPDVSYQSMFPDVKDGMYYSQAITWAAQNNIITGYTATKKFGVGDYITREQIATILYRYAESKGEDVDVNAGLFMFPDGDSVSAFAKKGMEYEVYKGHIRGDGEGYLNPYSNTNRAEIATMLMRYLEKPQVVDVPTGVQTLVNLIKESEERVGEDRAVTIEYGDETGVFLLGYISYLEKENALEFYAEIDNWALVRFRYDLATTGANPCDISVAYVDGSQWFVAWGKVDIPKHGINSIISFTLDDNNNLTEDEQEWALEVSNICVYTAMMGWNGLIAIVNPELRLNNLGFASYVNLF